MDVLRGVAHGKIIELESELALPEGQPVTWNRQQRRIGRAEIEP